MIINFYNLGGGGSGSGGTSNYNELSNKPQINGVTLSGNVSSDALHIEAEAYKLNAVSGTPSAATNGNVYAVYNTGHVIDYKWEYSAKTGFSFTYVINNNLVYDGSTIAEFHSGTIADFYARLIATNYGYNCIDFVDHFNAEIGHSASGYLVGDSNNGLYATIDFTDPSRCVITFQYSNDGVLSPATDISIANEKNSEYFVTNNDIFQAINEPYWQWEAKLTKEYVDNDNLNYILTFNGPIDYPSSDTVLATFVNGDNNKYNRFGFNSDGFYFEHSDDGETYTKTVTGITTDNTEFWLWDEPYLFGKIWISKGLIVFNDAYSQVQDRYTFVDGPISLLFEKLLKEKDLDYDKINNKPSINNIVLSGNVSSDTILSGHVKTVNGKTIIGSGNVVIKTYHLDSVEVDSAMTLGQLYAKYVPVQYNWSAYTDNSASFVREDISGNGEYLLHINDNSEYCGFNCVDGVIVSSRAEFNQVGDIWIANMSNCTISGWCSGGKLYYQISDNVVASMFDAYGTGSNLEMSDGVPTQQAQGPYICQNNNNETNYAVTGVEPLKMVVCTQQQYDAMQSHPNNVLYIIK